MMTVFSLTSCTRTGTLCPWAPGHQHRADFKRFGREFFLGNFLKGLGIDWAVGVFGFDRDFFFAAHGHSRKLFFQSRNDLPFAVHVMHRLFTLARIDHFAAFVGQRVIEGDHGTGLDTTAGFAVV